MCIVFSLAWPCNPHECKKEEYVENLVCMLATQHSEIKNGLSSIQYIFYLYQLCTRIFMLRGGATAYGSRAVCLSATHISSLAEN